MLSEQIPNPSPHSPFVSWAAGEGEEGRDACISQDVLAEYSVRPQACGNQKATEGTHAHLCTSWQALQNRDRNWTHLGKIPTVPGPPLGSAALRGPESRALQSRPRERQLQAELCGRRRAQRWAEWGWSLGTSV